MLRGDFGGPRLHLAALHLDGGAARPAHQMVMVVRRAAPVHRLAGVGAQRVDEAGGGHRLQRAVDGGQPMPRRAGEARRAVPARTGTRRGCPAAPRSRRAAGWCGPAESEPLHVTGCPRLRGSPRRARCGPGGGRRGGTALRGRIARRRPRPAAFRMRRCWLTSGCGTASASTSSCTQRATRAVAARSRCARARPAPAGDRRRCRGRRAAADPGGARCGGVRAGRESAVVVLTAAKVEIVFIMAPEYMRACMSAHVACECAGGPASHGTLWHE